MKPLAAIASFVAVSIPALASACPGAACGACGHGGGSLSQYVSALGIGILGGIGSVSLEQMWRARRKR